MGLGLGFVSIESPPTTSQYISIQSFALSATVWSEFQCQIMAHQFEPLPPVWGWCGPDDRKWYQSKCHPHAAIRFKRNANAFLLNAIVDVRLHRHDMNFLKYLGNYHKLATPKLNTA